MTSGAAYKIPDIADVFEGFNFKTKPWDPQLQALAFALDGRPKCAVWLPIGSGKTWVALNIAERKKARRILVVCPNSVIRLWREQAEIHVGRDAFMVKGMADDRLQIINAPFPGIFVLNFEGLLPAFCSRKSRGGKSPYVIDYKRIQSIAKSFELLIIDEIHHCKDPRAKSSKICQRLGQYIPNVLELTGTPMAKGVADLWSQIFVLDGGKRLGRSYWQFLNYYFYQSYYKWLPKRGSEAKILAAIDDIVIHFTDEEVHDSLPEMVRETRSFPLSKTQQMEYDGIERALLGGIESGKIRPSSVPERQMMLAEVAGGFLMKNGLVHTEFCPNPKLELLMELVDDLLLSQGKVIISHFFAHEGRMISRALSQAGIGHVCMRGEIKDKAGAEHQFRRDDSVRVLVANPASCGEGVNFSDDDGMVANKLIFYSNRYSALARQQMEGRTRRAGQKRRCVTIDLLAENTIDQFIYESVIQDRATVDNALAYFRRRSQERT